MISCVSPSSIEIEGEDSCVSYDWSFQRTCCWNWYLRWRVCPDSSRQETLPWTRNVRDSSECSAGRRYLETNSAGVSSRERKERSSMKQFQREKIMIIGDVQIRDKNADDEKHKFRVRKCNDRDAFQHIPEHCQRKIDEHKTLGQSWWRFFFTDRDGRLIFEEDMDENHRRIAP